jgi:hypothetical protein
VTHSDLQGADTSPTAAPTARTWVPAVVIAGVFAALTAWSWRRWPDPLVDFGRELYVAWQLADGHLLYRDVASLFGPLSPYLNALWFRVFGVSLLTIAGCNLVILAALTWAIYVIVRRGTDRVTATTCSLVFLLVFGFSQYVTVGNYNFVTPYSHEITHGVFLSAVMIVALARGLTTGSVALMAMAGLCFGLVSQTKAEVALAAVVSALTGFAAAAIADRDARMRVLRAAAVFAVTAIVPPLGFLWFFASHLGAADAAALLAAPNRAVAMSGIGASAYYRAGAGLDAPLANAMRMAGAFMAIAGFAALLASLAMIQARRRLTGRSAVVLRVGVRALVVILLGWFAPWTLFPRALPLTTLLVLVAVAAVMFRNRADREAWLRYLSLLCWSAFALAMLAKMVLYVRVSHYGFALAMPAATTLVAGLVWLAPAAVARAGGSAREFRTLALLAIAVACAVHVGTSHAFLRAKTLAIGRGADGFLAFDGEARWQGRAAREAEALVERTLAPGGTLAVVPEGAMINFLTRRRNSTPYHTLMPPEVQIYGEERILGAFRAAPPDFVLLVSKETQEYGVGRFGGASYGRALAAWIDQAYEPVTAIGRDERGEPAMMLLKRRDDRAVEPY